MEIVNGKRVYDIHDAIAALREVVQGREDFVYTDSPDCENNVCVNWLRDGDGWRPSCIVGHVLTMWGFPEEDKVHCQVRGPSGTLAVQDEIDTTPDVLAILGVAQGSQDNGSTWGEALGRAETRYARYA